MRRLLLCLAVLAASAGMLLAEPLVLEQADPVLAPKTVEVGLSEIDYNYDKAIITDSSGNTVTTLTNTALIVPAFARYAVNSKLECKAAIPYSSLSNKSEPASGTATTTTDAGMADPTIGAKYKIYEGMCKISAAADINVPLGQKSTKIASAFLNGWNIKPGILASKEWKKLRWNLNVTYNYKGEYTDENSTKQKPGDELAAGVGAEYDCTKVHGLTFIAEAVYDSLQSAKSAGSTVSGSSGARMDGIIGARWNKGNIKTKLGLDLSLGDEKYRAYDYKILAGITYLIK